MYKYLHFSLRHNSSQFGYISKLEETEVNQCPDMSTKAHGPKITPRISVSDREEEDMVPIFCLLSKLMLSGAKANLSLVCV